MNPSSSSFPNNNSFSISLSGVAFGNYVAQSTLLPNQAQLPQSQVPTQAQAQAVMVLQELLQLTQSLGAAWSGFLGGNFQGQGSMQQFGGQAQFGGQGYCDCQAQFGYGNQAQFGYGNQAQYGYGNQAQFGYGNQAQFGYGGQAQFGYGGQAQFGYGNQAQFGYGNQAQFGYGNQAQFGYGGQGMYGYGNQAQYGGQADVNLNFGYQQLPGETQKMWDVWFDSKDGQKTVQRSPIVLDLNKNGKADITGKNITGDGKIDGPTTMFDLDPNSVSYEFKSQQRRPGSGAPAVAGGHWVDADGKEAKKGPPKGTQPKFNGYHYLDKDGNVVGEMKNGLYNYGKQEKREATEWLAKDGGDGFLVADLNGDGEINSAVEMFGTEGTDGAKYKNGYEKLAALYDKNHDGKVNGNELSGLKVWVDANADGKVQEGELQSLQQNNITNLDVGNYNATTMESNYQVGGQVAPYFNLNANLGLYGYGQQSYYSQNPYFPNFPQAQPGTTNYF